MTQMTTTQKNKNEQIRDLVKSYQPAMEKLLGKSLSAERMTQIALINIGKIPKLAECSPASLMGAILESTRLGLEPGAGAGHTWLIPFYNKRKERMEVQLIPDYRAIVKRLKTHAGAAVVFAEAVYQNDQFEHGAGPEGLFLNWRPADGDRGPIVKYFACAWAKDKTLLGVNVMTIEEIKAIQKRSKAGSSGPWISDPVWMAKKTVVRPLNKLIPHEDTTLTRMAELDDQDQFGIPQDLGVLVDPKETKTIDAETVADDSPDAPKASKEKPKKATTKAQPELPTS